ncbi:MAG TPA: heme-copper oxidase subunit III [Bryobacteraceae bacterium]|nr:heme-copper oxidase subunit III [Bryobacteraceae bacterium]
MAASLTHDIIQGPPPPIDPGWGGGGDDSEGRGADRRASFTGLFVGLAACVMLFAALTSAFVVRRGLTDMDEWVSIHKPPILFWNTGILLLSSVVLDISRRALKAGERTRFNLWWSAATALGILFLVGQAIAWYDLRKAGLYISTTPASSFFYVFTAAHAAHVLGGVAALIYVDVQALRLRLGPAKRTWIDVTAIFWHFLDGLWLFLMVLFYVWG